MKDIIRKIAGVFAVLCIAVTSVSCSTTSRSDKTSSSESEKETSKAVLYTPFSVGDASEENELELADPEDPDALDEEDPTSPSEGSSESEVSAVSTGHVVQTEVRKVTTPQGETVTEPVAVTESGGQAVTESGGQAVTEMQEVTEVVEVTEAEASGENGESGESGNYSPKMTGKYAMWLDISKNENFTFEGQFIKVQFKVKDDAPNGDYSVRISPDLSDIAGVSVRPSEVIEGTIKVNNGEATPVDVADKTGDMIMYGDNVAVKQGDTFDYYINVKNNTGLAAFCIWFYYDSNALEFVESVPAGEFEEVARNAEFE